MRMSSVATVAAALVAVISAPAFAQEPVRITFDLSDAGPSKEIQSSVGGVEGVAECTASGKKVTIVVKEEGRFKLTALLTSLKDLKTAKGAAITVVLEKLRIVGKIEITISGDSATAQSVLSKISKLRGVAPSGTGTFTCEAVSGGVTYGELEKALQKELEGEDPITDIVWIGPDKKKPEAKPNPTPTKKPGGG